MLKGTWEFDGQAWTDLGGNEDRPAMLWAIGRIQNFATKGCTVTCHNEAADDDAWGFATSTEAERGNLCHWNSYRPHPFGYADDTWVGVRPQGERSGRHGDAGRGLTRATDTMRRLNQPTCRTPQWWLRCLDSCWSKKRRDTDQADLRSRGADSPAHAQAGHR